MNSNHKNSKQASKRRLVVAFLLISVTAILASSSPVHSQDSPGPRDAMDLLSGFDRARIESAFPPIDERSTGELAKLVYRLNSIDAQSLASRVSDANDENAIDQDVEVGRVIAIDGTIASKRRIDVPSRLADVLEFEQIDALEIQTLGDVLTVLTSKFPRGAVNGDRVRGVGVVINNDSPSSLAIVAAKLAWIPGTSDSTGWRLLGAQGVDIGMIADVSTRDRKPLVAEDSDAFYAMLAASRSIAGQEDLPDGKTVGAIKMLTDAKSMSGEWIRLDLETVQITRIAVTDALRRDQLNGDHYFQIDAVADLGRTVIKVEKADHDPNDVAVQKRQEATFENRYPVSLVMVELPPFLIEAIGKKAGVGAVVAEVSRQIIVDGFFFRLWSYQTEYMKQFGGEDQFGPLVIAARIRDVTPATADPVGVSLIGQIAAVVILAGMLLTWLWHRSTTSGDRVISERRRRHESADIHFPD